MKWYKKLTIEQKLVLKDLCETICGVKYNDLIRILGMRLTIETIYNKLKLEGFDI